jgi:hypothetical protein
MFPADDQVAGFVVCIAAARNDIEEAVTMSSAAAKEDNPALVYRHRLVLGHFFEAAEALKAWEKRKAVREFVGELPASARKERERALAAFTKVGRKTLAQSRNSTFHYPAPSKKYKPDPAGQLQLVLQAMADTRADILKRDRRVRFLYADLAMLSLAIGNRRDLTTDVAENWKASLQGAVAFVRFADVMLAAYARDRQRTARSQEAAI